MDLRTLASEDALEAKLGRKEEQHMSQRQNLRDVHNIDVPLNDDRRIRGYSPEEAVLVVEDEPTEAG